jgi:hypothetical protein
MKLFHFSTTVAGAFFRVNKSRCCHRVLCRFNDRWHVEEQRYIWLPFNSPLNTINPSKLWFITLKMTTATLSETSENYHYFTWPNSAGQSYFCFHFFFFPQNCTYSEQLKIFSFFKSRHLISNASLSQLTSHHVLTSLNTDDWSTAAGSTDMYRR